MPVVVHVPGRYECRHIAGPEGAFISKAQLRLAVPTEDRVPVLMSLHPATIPGASVVKTLIDVTLPRSFGRTRPRRLTHVIRYRLPASAPLRVAIASTVVRAPAIQVSRRAPIRIAPPLRGRGWVDLNGCCGHPTSEHERLLLPSNGSYRTPEIFAIDWTREVHGRIFTGDGSKLADYPSYGAPIHAVADGVVVSAINNRPQVPPHIALADFWSDSLPFAFRSFTVQGTAVPGPEPGTVKIIRQPRRVTQAEPLIDTVSNFGR